MPDNDKDIFDFGDQPSEAPPETEPEEAPAPLHFMSDILAAKNLSVFNPCDLHGSLKVIHFKAEADKDYIAGSQFSLFNIPASQVRVLGAISVVSFAVSGPGRLGWAKYKTRGRETIATDLSGFGIIEPGTQAILQDRPLLSEVFDSLEGIGVVFTTMEDGREGDYIEGNIIYIKQ